MVYKLYKKYVHPLARVIRGLPISWGPNFAAVKHSDDVWTVVWSSCSRFIAVGLPGSTELLDAVTLERLQTFAHPSSDHGCLGFSPDGRLLTWIDDHDGGSTTWDLQTGGRISAIPSIPTTFLLEHFSSTYSMDGNIVAVACRDLGNNAVTAIYTYNLISGTHTHFHRVSEGRIVAQIWTHGEFLRFATVKPGFITIWQVGFTSEHTPTEIESLPAPGDTGSEEHLFLPTLSRLAFILGEAVLIWDARDSRFLLNFVGNGRLGGLSFSSDGRFFACGTRGQVVHLWKESPTGYLPHQKLVHEPPSYRTPTFLSPDGESIITFKGREIKLWRTTDPISPPSSVPPQPAKQTDFVLTFSPEKSFIATGRLGRNIATIIDLKSGDPRLIVDTGTRICGLGVTWSTAIVVGEEKIITWNLPAEDCVLDARANVHDSIRTIVFNHPPPPPGRTHSASISPDFNHLVIMRGREEGLDIYDMSTGKHIVGATEDAFRLWFTRDGREVWYSTYGHLYGQKIIRDGGSNIIGLEPLRYGDVPSGGHLWESSHGHKVTDDGWILDSRKKRVMWLPHHWRVSKEDRIWDERFLALFNRGLPEPVVIELYE